MRDLHVTSDAFPTAPVGAPSTHASAHGPPKELPVRSSRKARLTMATDSVPNAVTHGLLNREKNDMHLLEDVRHRFDQRTPEERELDNDNYSDTSLLLRESLS